MVARRLLRSRVEVLLLFLMVGFWDLAECFVICMIPRVMLSDGVLLPEFWLGTWRTSTTEDSERRCFSLRVRAPSHSFQVG